MVLVLLMKEKQKLVMEFAFTFFLLPKGQFVDCGLFKFDFKPKEKEHLYAFITAVLASFTGDILQIVFVASNTPVQCCKMS